MQSNLYLNSKVNNTSDIQNTKIWHSTFCQSSKCTNKSTFFLNFCHKIMSAGFCKKVECHKVIFWCHWSYFTHSNLNLFFDVWHRSQLWIGPIMDSPVRLMLWNNHHNDIYKKAGIRQPVAVAPSGFNCFIAWWWIALRKNLFHG